MADGNGTTSYDYDPIGRLTESIRGGRTVAYSYDGAGRLNSVDYPGSLGSVALDYDAEGRLDEITDWDSRVTSFAYDGLDRITSITRPGDLLSSFAYDALGRVTGIDHEYDGSPVMELGYEYDAVGNVVERTDDQGAASFTYDDLDRLTVADYPGSDDYSYAYDAVGNLTSITNPSGTSTHTYDAADRISDTGFVYDDNGALTSDGVRSFTYDALGRLVGVTGPSLSAAYTFDGEGNRLSETVNSVTTAFDLDVRGLPTVLVAGDKSYLPGMPSLGYETSSGWLGTLADAQGSVLQTIDSAGVTSALVRYDPYGNARPGSTAVSGIGYTGEWADPAALVNLRFRAYDPSLGRFLSQDSFAGSLPVPLTGNRNAYALGNPIRNEDPSGHFVATAAAWSLDTATEWVAQQCNVTNLWSCFVNFSLAPGLGGLSGAADALAGAVTRRTDAALAILGRSVPSLGSTLKANYIRGFGGLLDDLLKGGAKLLGRTSAILSGVFTAADQWGVDADRDAGSRLFRAGAKGVLAGGAGLVVGGLFATACAPTVVLALACGAVGGIVGSVAGGLVADAGLAVADYASPRVDNAVRLAQDALGSIQAAVSPHLDNGLNAIQGVVADIFQW